MSKKLSQRNKNILIEIREELKLIRDERRELLKEYRYWKRKEYKIKDE